MNRNTEAHFGQIPTIDLKRSTFDLSFDHKTTFNTGDIVPIMVQEILPGDTFNLETNFIVRMQTPIKPVMDDAFIDIYYFFVPNRLVWDHWPEFMGENKDGAWDEQETEYTIPSIKQFGNEMTIQKGSVADHMGLPINSTIISADISVLPFRAYTLIYNEWFRNQNLQAPLPTYHQNDNSIIITTEELRDDPAYGGKLLKANKFADYFTTALPEPQKGDPVTINIGDEAPVLTSDKEFEETKTGKPLKMWLATTGNMPDPGTLTLDGQSAHSRTLINVATGKLPEGTRQMAVPSNLYADLSSATSVTVNQLRQAIQIQKFLERDARSGTRYIEIIKGHFGVTSPDARMQRPEYLGGNRFPINMDQVLQTSESTTNSPQGNTAAFSLTGARSSAGFTKSFTEHGYIIGLAVVRTQHSYQQGINKMWSRKRRYDYYWREFANLGEQEVKVAEIYNDSNADYENKTFGYQERYAEYRYNPNIITGEMRSTYAQSLDVWHYGDEYSTRPYLSAKWCEETANNMDRTLAVQSNTADQFLAEFYFKIKATRPMPIYGVPGMMDHF